MYCFVIINSAGDCIWASARETKFRVVAFAEQWFGVVGWDKLKSEGYYIQHLYCEKV